MGPYELLLLDKGSLRASSAPDTGNESPGKQCSSPPDGSTGGSGTSASPEPESRGVWGVSVTSGEGRGVLDW
jgi:hypothetical protein